jgi:PadR family transcriptional regulator, regulatory protein PadR
MRGDVVKGHLDLLLLSVLEDAPAHGYLVIDRLRLRSDGAFVFPEGTIYPALHRLEAAGLLASRWAEDAPRRRRVYELTQRGRQELGRQRADWERFAGAVRLVVAGAR